MLSEHEKRTMSLFRALSLLEDRIDRNVCDGDCDEKPPYVKCEGCLAAATLNEATILIRGAL